MSDKFINAVKFVLKHEGGYVNDPNDKGGETNFGISKKEYPHLDIKNLTEADAIEIYQRDYWEKYRYNEIEDATLAAKIFDLCVNMGPGNAAVTVQLTFNRISPTDRRLKVDAVLGSRSIYEINNFPVVKLFIAELKLSAIRFYIDRPGTNFLEGWLNRVLEDPES